MPRYKQSKPRSLYLEHISHLPLELKDLACVILGDGEVID